ncbi:DUF1295 domain-containing protein [Rhodococcus sp. IEGM 1408]|uniref:DUF1295 domain-containing protein n=1 Tax=Rhodococcus sp. IEGM 1408 TaxID=3082220 RepID=UPI0029542ED9|nr:DUF1295 domain-containing protein [Rhodococcus sp. IEGM 1408]MDV8002797.1 DUF1295 domain-containing protein [Rhodococcus sp. IEGM 1408]
MAGMVLAAGGIAYEAVADAQLAEYKRDPDRLPVMSCGRRKLSRHPNYFGDACMERWSPPQACIRI